MMDQGREVRLANHQELAYARRLPACGSASTSLPQHAWGRYPETKSLGVRTPSERWFQRRRSLIMIP
jgi:hypothetical protein